jgi:hypothetical protein
VVEKQMRAAATDAAYWIVEIMRGSNRDTHYTQAVMEKAREHIQRLALLLHDSASAAPSQDSLQSRPNLACAFDCKWPEKCCKHGNYPHAGDQQ